MESLYSVRRTKTGLVRPFFKIVTGSYKFREGDHVSENLLTREEKMWSVIVLLMALAFIVALLRPVRLLVFLSVRIMLDSPKKEGEYQVYLARCQDPYQEEVFLLREDILWQGDDLQEATKLADDIFKALSLNVYSLRVEVRKGEELIEVFGKKSNDPNNFRHSHR